MRYAFLVAALTLLLLAACGVEPTPTQTPSPQLLDSIGQRQAPAHVWMDLGDGVVVSFVEGLSPEVLGKVAYVTHVPSGSQLVLDRQAQVSERHDGRDDGPARLDAVLADEEGMERIMAVLQSDDDARPQQSIVDWIHFIKFGGITYQANGYFSGTVTVDGERDLSVEDLGPEFYRVAFRLKGYVGRIHLSQNGDAAYLDPGTPVYTVNGYAPEFRLATINDGKVTLFQADTNPAAKVGADLLDIRGRVASISIHGHQSGIPELASIGDPELVEWMVDMALAAPVDQDRRDREGEWYYLAFHLEDGTAAVRNFFLESGELARGIMTHASFQLSILQVLAEEGALPPTDGPRISEAFAIRLAMWSFGWFPSEIMPVEEARDAVTKLMRRSEYAALTGGSIPESADSLVWVVEAEGEFRDAVFPPGPSSPTFRYASVAIDAQTGEIRAGGRSHEPVLGSDGMTPLGTR